MSIICLPMVSWVLIVWMNVFSFLYLANVEGARDYNQPKKAWEIGEGKDNSKNGMLFPHRPISCLNN
jgi:hypothetical protein